MYSADYAGLCCRGTWKWEVNISGGAILTLIFKKIKMSHN